MRHLIPILLGLMILGIVTGVAAVMIVFLGQDWADALLWIFAAVLIGSAILVVTMLAALGATLLAVNFHLASGANHPWLIPKEGFDETIDVDTVLIMFQIALIAFSGYLLLKMRRERRFSAPPGSDSAPAASP
jgi:membrane-bound ClpP family serine protease